MSKWADWCISAVRYTSDRTRIAKVQVRLDNGQTIGTPFEKARTDVVEAIKAKMTVITIFRDGAEWLRGAVVDTVTVDGEEFLRTDANQRRVDNLGELPEF